MSFPAASRSCRVLRGWESLAQQVSLRSLLAPNSCNIRVLSPAPENGICYPGGPRAVPVASDPCISLFRPEPSALLADSSADLPQVTHIRELQLPLAVVW